MENQSKQSDDLLVFKKENVWERYEKEHRLDCFEFSRNYKNFLNTCKTERECVGYIRELLEKKSFIDLDHTKNKSLKDKDLEKGYYRIVHGKAVLIYVPGKKRIQEGLNIIGGHIDSPRIDIKPNPLYESEGLAYFKTHYYGGIKKYQWTSMPLSIHGVFVKQNGDVVEVTIGEDENDPVFTITDLLPHLAKDQMQKKLGEGIEGEDLNILLGSSPWKDKEAKERYKFNVLKILHEKYGIIEEDFVSAELQVVPAFKARDLGFDQCMIGGYGQDDRAPSYIALRAILAVENLNRPCVCYLSDKEEIGSVGNTGAQSAMFEDFLTDILVETGEKDPFLGLRSALKNSKMLSADVTAGYDPTFGNVYEKSNAAYIGKGVVLTKYTGARGKSGASDANPEFVAEVRKVFNQHDIAWQAGELGKVDQGGGGTIALFFANLGIDVLDCGISLLSMHAPFEVVDKMDVYTAYRAFKAFYEEVGK
jgi:aspartyl aminopeptidase